MTQDADILDPAFEKRIEDVVAEKKNEIEKVLVETIDQEKVKARQRIAELEQEFQKEKENLNRHKVILEGVKSATEDIRGPLRKHIEQARHLRIQIRQMATQILEECRKAGELTRKIRELSRNADEETALLQARLADRYGTTAPIADSLERSGINADLEQEVSRLNEFVERLSAEIGEPASDGEGVMEIGIGRGDDLQVPENLGPGATVVKSETPQKEEEHLGTVPPPAAPKDTAGVTDLDAISGALEAYRRTESVPNGGEFHYYQKAAAIVLDGESLLAPMTRLIESAKNRHARLAETRSAKEQFFLKREIIDQQELLRKVVLRAVKLCEKEKGFLPHHTSDIINVQTLKDILERLNMGNWSDSYEMKTFEDEISALKAVLSARTSDRLTYQKSILDQLN